MSNIIIHDSIANTHFKIYDRLGDGMDKTFITSKRSQMLSKAKSDLKEANENAAIAKVGLGIYADKLTDALNRQNELINLINNINSDAL